MRSRSCGRPTTARAAASTSARAAAGSGTRTATSRRRRRATSGTWRCAPASASAATASSSIATRRPAWSRRACRASKGRFSPDYPPYDLDILDNTRVDVVAARVPGIRTHGRPAASQHHPPRQRPHGRHPARCPDAARHGRRERRRPRPDRRGHLAQPVLERVGHLRARGRRAERTGPRGRAPIACPRHQPLRQAAVPSTARSTRPRPCCARWS